MKKLLLLSWTSAMLLCLGACGGKSSTASNTGADAGPDTGPEAGSDQQKGKEISVDLPGGAKMDFVWVEPGKFSMGSPASDRDAKGAETPQHQVTITKGFYLGKCETTQAQWQAVMGTKPWSGLVGAQENPNCPVVGISWDDVQAIVHKLNQAAGDSLYRLPTEAEWEYACRAGTTTRWSFGDAGSKSTDYAWYWENTWNEGLYARPVGTKLPNPWGLYDMHGNVWEWVHDYIGFYSNEAQVDPTGPVSPESYSRVYRGGCFQNFAQDTRSAGRNYTRSDARGSDTGARLLRSK